MSIKTDSSGRRYVEAEIEVPGTPEQVWEAIATGPGVSSWFVPTEEKEDGSIVSHFGPGMDAVARRTAWEPPFRFAGESAGFGPDCPPLATEWTVEAKDGGTCVVRVVHSLFASTDAWDKQLEGIESGWPDFFRILYLYLQHFPGKQGAMFQRMETPPGTAAEIWEKLTAALRVDGVVENTGSAGHPHQLLLRTENALIHLFALKMGPQVYLSLRMYVYGEDAAAMVAKKESEWAQFLHKVYEK